MRPTAISFQWADDVHTFDLRLGQIRELEDKCKAGVFVILARLFDRSCSYDDIRETIRLGLIGGGKSPGDAWKIVVRYVDERPMAESLPVAQAIMGALAHGALEDAAEADPQTAAETEESTSPPSTPAEPSSASDPEKSMDSVFGNGSRSSKAGMPRTAPSNRFGRRHPKNIVTA